MPENPEAGKLVNTRYAKSREYLKALEAAEKSGKCPFCPENRSFKNPVLKVSGGWIVKKNDWPYKNTLYHFVFIPNQHIEKLTELSPKDFEAIFGLLSWLIEEYKIPGGGFAMRFGNANYTGATVRHLHAHLIVPELDREGRAKIANFPIG
ncbi:MAG: hypothetical protein JW727_03420 [Candidatus Aenigmarchaeota archaeon]|nr:hypothetical protein [Candidatus Aenigmarchaeota archaeon]